MANLGSELHETHDETLAGTVPSTRGFRPWETRQETILVANAPGARMHSAGTAGPVLALQGSYRTQVTCRFPIPDRGQEAPAQALRFPDVSPGETADSQGLDLVMAYLRDHFRENVPMKALADLVRLSLRQFHRNFKKKFGMPPNQYLIRMRVMAARDMLLSDKRPVAKIAYDLGFADDTLFIRQFKARMGMTPLQYRKANR